MTATVSGQLTSDGGRAVLEHEVNIASWQTRDAAGVAVNCTLADGQCLRMKENDGTATLTVTFASGTLKRYVNTGGNGVGGTEVESYSSPASVVLTSAGEALKYAA